jgi:hypothetical protein
MLFAFVLVIVSRACNRSPDIYMTVIVIGTDGSIE